MLLQHKPTSAEQAPSNLAELAQQTRQKQPSYGGGATTSSSSSSSSSKIPAPADELPLHQQAFAALHSAEAAVKAAKEAKAAAADSISISISTGGETKAKEAKQAAEEQLEAAELQVEVAKVWVLSCSPDKELAAFFNLPHSVMQKFRPFGM
jgi:hypothetical protein